MSELKPGRIDGCILGSRNITHYVGQLWWCAYASYVVNRTKMGRLARDFGGTWLIGIVTDYFLFILTPFFGSRQVPT
jgi:hypothetical protein